MSLPESNTTTQLKKLIALVPGIIKEAEYSELYGYDLNKLADSEDGLIIRDRLLKKFLTANKFVVNDSADQLKATLAWRRDFNPLSAAFLETHSEKLSSLGSITSVPITLGPKVVAPVVAAVAAAPAVAAPLPSSSSTTSGKAVSKDAAEDEPSEESKEVSKATEAETEVTSAKEELPKAVEATEDAVVTEEVEAPKEDVVAAKDVEEPTTEESKTDAAVIKDESSEIQEVAKPKAVEPVEEEPEVGVLVTGWNLYGAVKNRKEIFSDLNSFLRWRVGEMERGIALLDFTHERTSYVAQIHDYFGVSFLFLDAPTKAATRATIEVFQKYYPEFLNVKYFVNVPTVMSWLFAFTKLFVAKETVDKFRVVPNGSELAKTAGPWVPKQYGGNADSLEEITAKDIKLRHPELATLYVPEKAKVVEPTPVVTAADPEPAAVPDADATKAEPAVVTESPAESPAEPVTEPVTVDTPTPTTTTTTTAPVSVSVPAEETSTVAAKVAEPKTEAPTTSTEPKSEVPATTTDVPEPAGAGAAKAEPGAVAEAPKPTGIITSTD